MDSLKIKNIDNSKYIIIQWKCITSFIQCKMYLIPIRSDQLILVSQEDHLVL
jgi:hypothetical protein